MRKRERKRGIRQREVDRRGNRERKKERRWAEVVGRGRRLDSKRKGKWKTGRR